MGLGTHECIHLTEHKTFAKMKNEQIANLLAQIATNQIDENEVADILREQYNAMPCDEPENRFYDRLFAATRINRANKSVMDGFKTAVCKMLMNLTKGYESYTKIIGSRMYKLYYTLSYHWERLHLPELTDEQLVTMSPAEINAYNEKRQKLLEWQQLHDAITELENKLAPMKLELKGKSEALAALMPNSKCIHRTPVLQTTTTDE